MERPEQIYLPHPIEISGIKITRTLAGINYYLHHWRHVQATVGNRLDTDGKKHLQLVIENLEIHKQLMESK
jgi:hypothetical protein